MEGRGVFILFLFSSKSSVLYFLYYVADNELSAVGRTTFRQNAKFSCDARKCFD
jgi:hypothetical protein